MVRVQSLLREQNPASNTVWQNKIKIQYCYHTGQHMFLWYPHSSEDTVLCIENLLTHNTRHLPPRDLKLDLKLKSKLNKEQWYTWFSLPNYGTLPRTFRKSACYICIDLNPFKRKIKRQEFSLKHMTSYATLWNYMLQMFFNTIH